MRPLIMAVAVALLVSLGGSLVAQVPMQCPCQHAVPCQHQMPCVHSLHPFDTIQGLCPSPFGPQPCQQMVPCAHRMHPYDTMHAFDTAHLYDICSGM